MNKGHCTHHWVIDQLNGGRCKKCPAVRDFGALMKRREREVAEIRQPARQHGGKRGRPRTERRKNGTRKG